MALIRVTAAQVRQTADQLRQYDSQFKNQVDNLETHELNLCSMWEGESKNAFHNAFNSDKEYMNQFYVLIEKYCQALEQIAQAYEEAEARNTETATKRNH
ncbi:MAG: WXG100 family type VII secretion target [Lachnospiraceae bacterium]|jgi:WXG100 family type VII secretion target|nr:WXG100 family type VII secretion target [Lachnospiraceae bacterium]